MNRRQWMLGVSAAALVGPSWLRSAFAASPTCPPSRQRQAAIKTGVDTAAAAGKPLLVLTAPGPKTPSPWTRGRAFGEWLNHGGDTSLAALAEVVVICATTEDLRAVVTGVSDADPLMRLVHDGKVTDLTVALEEPVFGKGGMTDTKKADSVIDGHIEALSKLLAGALKPTRKARSDRARAALAAADVSRLSSLDDLVLVDRAAALLAETRGREAAVVEALAKAARRRLLEGPIPGSHWARSGGCGETIEGVEEDDQMRVACGMGFVAPRSQRFVRFYTCES